jgi:hypothetical protein
MKRVTGEGHPEHSLMWFLVLAELSCLVITVIQAIMYLFLTVCERNVFGRRLA